MREQEIYLEEYKQKRGKEEKEEKEEEKKRSTARNFKVLKWQRNLQNIDFRYFK